MTLREPTDSDWDRILELANESVSEVPAAGTQEEWLHNRRNFKGEQHHYVYVDDEDGIIKGYCAVERAADDPERHWRLFVVTKIDDLTTIGETMFAKLDAILEQANVGRSRFVEHSTNQILGRFIRNHGYREVRRFDMKEGGEAAIFEKFHG